MSNAQGPIGALVSTPAPTPHLPLLDAAAGTDDESLIEQSRGLLNLPLGSRDRLATYLLGSGFLVAAVALGPAAAAPPVASPATVAFLVAAYAAVSRIDFEIGTGSAVPTELTLVPMFFLIPVQIVPLCV